MTICHPTFVLYAYLGSTWTDISAYQIGAISAHWGINGNGSVDFIAGTGTLQFTLNNATYIFSPQHASVISADWKKGCRIKLVISYDTFARTLYGYVSDFNFETDVAISGEKVTVYVVDWMDKAAKYPIDYPTVLTTATSDEGVAAVVAAMPLAPQAQTLAVGTNSFFAIFDTTTDFTYALSEFAKICQSELCYLYLRKDCTYGETLVLENADTRAVVDPVYIPLVAASNLLLETGDALLLENGDNLLLEASEAFTSYDDAISYETTYGDNVVNDVRFRYYPRMFVYNSYFPFGIATTIYQYGWNLDGTYRSSLVIPAGETVTFRDNYGVSSEFRSPFWGIINKQKKVAQVDSVIGHQSKWLTANDDRTGASVTHTIDNFEEFPDHFEITITNTDAVDGYFFLLLVAWYLFLASDPVQVTTQDAASIVANDYQPLQFDMPYQTTGAAGSAFASLVLAKESEPRTVLNRINFNANRSEHFMSAFLSLDIGDCFPVTVASKGIDGDFYIQSFDFTIIPGKICNFSLGVKEALSGPASVAGLQVWYDASALSLADGASVASWTDMSGNGNHAAQATAGNRPLFVAANAAINNKSTVKLDNTDDFLTLTNQITGLDDVSVFVVFARNSTGSTNNIILTYSDTNYLHLQYGDSWYINGNPALDQSVPQTVGTFYIRSMIKDGGSVTRYTNNTAQTPQTDTGPSIGLRYIGLSGYVSNCEIAEIIVYNRAISANQHALIYNYLAVKYGI